MIIQSNTKFILMSLAMMAATTGQVQAGVISWDGAKSFNTSEGYTASGFLDGIEGWVTNDPYINHPTGDIGYSLYESGFTNSTRASGNMNVIFGGYDLGNGISPGIDNSNCSHPVTFTDSTTSLSLDMLEVTWRFAIQPSSTVPGESNANDTFGMALQDASGADIVRTDFETAGAGTLIRTAAGPVTRIDKENLPLRSDFMITSLVDGQDQTENTVLVGGSYNQVYDMRMSLTASDTVNIDFRSVHQADSFTSSWASVVADGQLGTDLSRDDLGQVAFNWELATSSDPGSNFIRVIDIEVALVSDTVTVPESGTFALLVLGLAGLGFARRETKA